MAECCSGWHEGHAMVALLDDYMYREYAGYWREFRKQLEEKGIV